MMRLGPFVVFVLLPMLPTSATVAQRQPTQVAELQEESIPAQDLAAPASPAAAPSPGANTNANPNTNPDAGQWIAVPAGKATAAEEEDEEAPAAKPIPSAAQP